MRKVRSEKSRKDEYWNAGPLATLFEGEPRARILDQALLLGSGEFTVSGLADGTGLSFKTVQSYLKLLESIEWVSETRKMGNAQAYRFNITNHMSSFINWATKFQKYRNTR
jgi:DNA-binding transcriptional regulator GbsR (MarR family)